MKRIRQSWIRGGALGLIAAGILCTAGQAWAQAAYPSADAAAEAFVSAVATGDDDKLEHVLGADFRRYVPSDAISRDDVYAFLAAWFKHHEIAATGPASAAFIVGEHGWSFPAPIVKNARGWHFDVRAGAREMQQRRIGRNESAAMETLKILCKAQQQYRASVGKGIPAQRIVSRDGRYDGLYWPPDSQAPASSPLSDDALVMGSDVPVDAALHGYRYTVLRPTDQTGCAFAAWPAAYGVSGKYSFAIGPAGEVVERDYGRQSRAADYAQVGPGMDSGWGKALP
ncbi:DUF2950 family protein [Bordetella petrii]|uniref:DUF2950 family protein n=1 Tax=Bordetella petrii TaxID=94624 RepID=UPI001A966DB0|nr:DUF2950 family protein [Bordetella petrii]MBO1113863.1 DUF2950 family protein [Bordetella petrii]